MFSKAKVQYMKHACSRSWVCISRGMPKVCFTVERHAEELSSADAAYLLYMCFGVLSQELQCPCSRVQTAEGHVLLKAGFLFFVAYPEIKFRKYDAPALPHKLSSGKTSLQHCKHKGCGICVL